LKEAERCGQSAFWQKNNHVESTMPESATFKPSYGTAYDSDQDENSFIGKIITVLSYILVIITLPISIWGCIKGPNKRIL